MDGFFLFSLVIALITLLVLFIAALGEGLGNGNREYIANIDGDLIVFRENSDFNIRASRLDQSTVRAVRRIDGVADAGGISDFKYSDNSSRECLESIFIRR